MMRTRNGTTAYAYDNADRVVSVTSPAPVTQTQYDSLGRVKKIIHPDLTETKNEYFLNGLLKKTYGSRIYPVEYTYDAQGRIKTMKTWQDFNEATGVGNSGWATTTWNYDTYRGWLGSKRDHNNVGVDYTYKASGRLNTRKWARNATPETTHTYNNAGDIETVSFSGAANNTYDRRGRVATVLKNKPHHLHLSGCWAVRFALVSWT